MLVMLWSGSQLLHVSAAPSLFFAAFAHLHTSCVIVCHSTAGSLHCVLYHWLDLIFLDV